KYCATRRRTISGSTEVTSVVESTRSRKSTVASLRSTLPSVGVALRLTARLRNRHGALTPAGDNRPGASYRGRTRVQRGAALRFGGSIGARPRFGFCRASYAVRKGGARSTAVAPSSVRHHAPGRPPTSATLGFEP